MLRLAALLAAAALLAGCARAHCTGRTGPCTGYGSLDHGGRTRTFRIHLPAAYDGRAQLPLLLALHGRGGDGDGMERLAGLEPLSDREGFLVVYPDGVERSWNDRRGVTPASRKGVDDAGFLVALLDHVAATWKVDARRTYVTGMSNGAFMTHQLACERADRLAAAAPVTGTLTVEQLPTCTPSRTVPMVLFHGTLDPFVLHEGGALEKASGGTGLSAAQTRQKWAELDGCSPAPVVTGEPDLDREDGTTVRREAHGGCRDDASVVLYTIEGGGHTWPGGWQYLGEWLVGRTSRDVSASEAMWEFMRGHALPP